MKLELIEVARTFRATDNNGNEYIVEQNADGDVSVHMEVLDKHDFSSYWEEVEDEEVLTAIVFSLSNVE